jgi:hypothetical protein
MSLLENLAENVIGGYAPKTEVLTVRALQGGMAQLMS